MTPYSKRDARGCGPGLLDRNGFIMRSLWWVLLGRIWEWNFCRLWLTARPNARLLQCLQRHRLARFHRSRPACPQEFRPVNVRYESFELTLDVRNPSATPARQRIRTAKALSRPEMLGCFRVKAGHPKMRRPNSVPVGDDRVLQETNFRRAYVRRSKSGGKL
jgi:hypothetical protein